MDPVARSLTVTDRCITLDAGTDLTLVDSAAEGAPLTLGRTDVDGLLLALAGNGPLPVDVYGQERMDGCIAADSVVAFGRLRDRGDPTRRWTPAGRAGIMARRHGGAAPERE